MIIDTHAHLFYPQIINKLDEVLENAVKAEISKIIIPATDIKSCRIVIELCEKYEMLYAACGIHPCDVKDAGLNDLELLREICVHQKVAAIGETGLDYYWDKNHIEKQKHFFKCQIELAKELNKPVVIHTRESLDDAISIISENYRSDLKAHFHCFTGSVQQLEKILSFDNVYVSFCGNITYKKFDTSAAESIPLNKLLTETDSPYLAPVPYRGKDNQPSYIVYTINRLAELKNISSQEIIKNAYRNAEKLYFNN